MSKRMRGELDLFHIIDNKNMDGTLAPTAEATIYFAVLN